MSDDRPLQAAEKEDVLNANRATEVREDGANGDLAPARRKRVAPSSGSRRMSQPLGSLAGCARSKAQAVADVGVTGRQVTNARG